MQQIQMVKIFSPNKDDDFQAVLSLLNDGVRLMDLCVSQKHEWSKQRISLGEINFGEIEISKIGDIALYQDAVLIYFPWRNTIVQTFDEEIFCRLRYLRNNYKINREEQKSLRERHIAIIGMSVGMSILKSCVLEGLAGEYTIADFDTIELSNLNRIDAGIFNIGQSKVELAYRFILEQDPFLKINICREVTASNIDEILGEKVDLIIDECDSIISKILIRSRASKSRIPVIMHTSDRGMLDIERYDLLDFESDWTLLKYESMADEDIRSSSAQIIAEYCDLLNADSRSKFSFGEIGKTLTSWPQLGGDVFAGAGNVAFAARNYLLYQNIRSGRYLLEPKVIITNPDCFE
jgi:molybdopterin/thiamine biosynthesis adenylyltransferase